MNLTQTFHTPQESMKGDLSRYQPNSSRSLGNINPLIHSNEQSGSSPFQHSNFGSIPFQNRSLGLDASNNLGLNPLQPDAAKSKFKVGTDNTNRPTVKFTDNMKLHNSFRGIDNTPAWKTRTSNNNTDAEETAKKDGAPKKQRLFVVQAALLNTLSLIHI